MIDIIFLLLIFFLVAAKWRPQEDFLPFRLPTAAAETLQVGICEPLEIYIFGTDGGCVVQIGNAQTVRIETESFEENIAVLMEKIKEIMLSQKRFAADPVEIICEAGVKWQYLAKIYNVFYGAGMTDITFAMTEHPEN